MVIECDERELSRLEGGKVLYLRREWYSTIYQAGYSPLFICARQFDDSITIATVWQPPAAYLPVTSHEWEYGA